MKSSAKSADSRHFFSESDLDSVVVHITNLRWQIDGIHLLDSECDPRSRMEPLYATMKEWKGGRMRKEVSEWRM